MKVCEWTADYTVGIAILDSHHQTLFDLINELFNLMNDNAQDKSIVVVLADLLEYTRYHFAEEELIMEKMNYPDLAAHRKLHQDLTKSIQDSYHEAHHGKATFVALHIANMGLAWLKNHIHTVDRKYHEYMKEQGIQV